MVDILQENIREMFQLKFTDSQPKLNSKRNFKAKREVSIYVSSSDEINFLIC